MNLKNKKIIWVMGVLMVLFLGFFKSELVGNLKISSHFYPDNFILEPDTKKKEVLSNSQERSLQSFENLYLKALHTVSEKNQLESYLSDLDLIRRSYLLLTNLKSDESERWLALDYFKAALDWTQNPAREQIINSLRALMLLDNLEDISNLDLRKSFAGDKMEVYAIFKKHAPEVLEEFEFLPEDGRIKKILRYAQNLM